MLIDRFLSHIFYLPERIQFWRLDVEKIVA